MEGAESDAFSRVAEHYDRLSKALTAGLDNYWRARAVDEADGLKKAKVLDVATGTGAIAIMLAKKHKNYSITGLDFNKEMLEIAVEKSREFKNVRYITGDAEDIQLKPNSFDIVISGFSLGAFNDISKALDEMQRVMKPGGKLILLDVNKLRSRVFSRALRVYRLFSVTPVFNSEIRKDVSSYVHSKAVEADKKNVIAMLESKGFRDVKSKDLSMKTVFIITGFK